MNARWRRIFGTWLVCAFVGMPVVPEAEAKGGHGGHGGGGGHARAPRVAAPQHAFKAPAYKPPRMPHAAAPARTNNKANANANAQARNANHAAHAATNTHNNNANKALSANAAAGNHAQSSLAAAMGSPFHYTYGTGTHARNYRAHGYGHGYRNRYYGNRYGYGRSQSNNRAIVGRLRSVHASLARINHDYKGHRVRAMHSVSMAIRQLSHRSMVFSNMGFAGANNRQALGMRRNGAGAGANARRAQPLTQAQSDARMSQALRNLQGVHMQLTNQAYHTNGHARARGHVQHAMRELNTALAIR